MNNADWITKLRLTSLFGIGMLALADALALEPLRDIVQIDVGSLISCALTREGGVKCWGRTSSALTDTGLLEEQHTTPVDMPGLTQDIVAIETAGGFYTCALTRKGGVKCQGENSAGQLGDGTTERRSEPVDVVGLNAGVAAISLGGEHACTLTTEGRVKCWGGNYHGQLGDGSQENRLVPVDVRGLESGVAAIAAGGTHTCALTVAGGVKCWGSNTSGQLGDGTPEEQQLIPADVSGLGGGVAAITAGMAHTCALTVAGGVKCWGYNFSGQLGDGTTGDSPTTKRPTPVDVVGLTAGVIAIAAGELHTCALTVEKRVKCWGYNLDAQLGDGTTAPQRLAPVDVIGLNTGVNALALGFSHTCALMDTGGVKCWGGDYYGALGGGINHWHSTPIGVIGLNANITGIAAGQSQTCALTRDGRGKCWGRNDRGLLGDGTQERQRTLPVDVLGLNARITAIDTDDFHTCALTRDKEVRCWGANNRGQLGDGTRKDRLKPVKVKGLSGSVIGIATSSQHTCALTQERGVKCWGYNGFGQVGDGTTERRRLTPVDVSGLTGGIKDISVGGAHTCALTRRGGIKCWGLNRDGQLGNGTTETPLAPVEVSGLDTGVDAIAAGVLHTCALMNDGVVRCWGSNESGQLGDGTTEQRLAPVDVMGLSADIVAIAAGGAHTCALGRGGKIQCWGNNGAGQLGDGATVNPYASAPTSATPVDVIGLPAGIAAIAAGGAHTCALMKDGTVKCWGANYSGQLGDGTAIVQPIPGDVMADDK